MEMEAYPQANISNRLMDGCCIFFLHCCLEKTDPISARPKLGFLYSLDAPLGVRFFVGCIFRVCKVERQSR